MSCVVGEGTAAKLRAQELNEPLERATNHQQSANMRASAARVRVDDALQTVEKEGAADLLPRKKG